MPSVSKAQHGLMGLVRSVKEGKQKLSEIRSGLRPKVARMMGEMTMEQLKEYTSTPAAPLPRHVGHSQARNARSA